MTMHKATQRLQSCAIDFRIIDEQQGLAVRKWSIRHSRTWTDRGVTRRSTTARKALNNNARCGKTEWQDAKLVRLAGIEPATLGFGGLRCDWKKWFVCRNSLKWNHIPKCKLRQDEEGLGRNSDVFSQNFSRACRKPIALAPVSSTSGKLIVLCTTPEQKVSYYDTFLLT